MNESEKRDRGLLYDPNGDDLRRLFLECKDRCAAYNTIPPSLEDERRAYLRSFLGKVGDSATVLSPFFCDYGSNIFLGDRFFSNHNWIVLDAGRVTIGNDVFIGPNCGFYTAAHPLDVARRNRGLEWAYPIAVGDNVWIGGSVTVLPGVTIGNGSVIGAGSVVTRDIPRGVLAFGNPCRVIRNL